MRTQLITAATCLALASPAAAEGWPYSSHGAWDVAVVELGGDLFCRAMTIEASEKISFAVWNGGNDLFSIQVYDGKTYYGEQSGTLYTRVDDHKVSFSATSVENSIVAFGVTRSYIDLISAGEMVYFDTDGDGADDLWFSMADGSEALASLDECSAKLGSDGA